MNLPLYTDRATEVLGLDPSLKLLGMASDQASNVPSKLIHASAESLESASVDTVITTWTLCTIPNVAKVLAEMRRLLKPHGKLLFVADERVRKWQNRLTPVWRRIAGGCHLNRPIASLVESAGFHISQMEIGYMPGPKLMTYMYEGSAQPA